MSKKVQLLDGSFASALRELGFVADDHKLWTAEANLKWPDKVRAVYERFIDMGVDYITTNTYHASFPLMLEEMSESEASLNIQRAVESLKDVVLKKGSNAKILGSVGCYGATLRNASEYNGSYVDNNPQIRQIMTNYHRRQVAELVKNDVHDIIFETIAAFDEVASILEACALFDVNIIISFSCKDGQNLRHGEPLKSAVNEALKNVKLIGVGINCTDNSHISALLQSITGLKKTEVFVYPNSAFESEKSFEKLRETGELVDLVREWGASGATVIGGCCGVTSKELAELRRIIDNIEIHTE